MKSIKIALFFFLLSFSCIAKDTTSVEFKRFAIGIHVSPDYCYRTLNVVSSTAQTTFINNSRAENELPAIGYTAGAYFSAYLKKQFSISLGVNFSQKAYKTKPLNLVDNNGVSAGTTELRYNYNFIEIPLKTNFIFGKKKLRFTTGVGATAAFLLYQQTMSKSKYSDGKYYTQAGKPNYIYNPFNLFLTGSVGLDWQLGKKIGLQIEPTYSYGLFETITAPITEHLWNAGLNVGCYIKL